MRAGPNPFTEGRPSRVLAEIRPEERARLTVPQMPPEKGDACCWSCLPDSIEPSCLVHAGYRPA